MSATHEEIKKGLAKAMSILGEMYFQLHKGVWPARFYQHQIAGLMEDTKGLLTDKEIIGAHYNFVKHPHKDFEEYILNRAKRLCFYDDMKHNLCFEITWKNKEIENLKQSLATLKIENKKIRKKNYGRFKKFLRTY